VKKLAIVGIIAGIVVAVVLAGAVLLSHNAKAEGDHKPEGTPSAGATTPTEGDQGEAIFQESSWVLTAWSDEAELPEAEITLVFDSGQVSGVSACNNYGGPTQVDGNSITFGEMFQTMMYCEDSADAELTYMALLASVDAWSIDEGVLSLFAGDVEVLTFEMAV